MIPQRAGKGAERSVTMKQPKSYRRKLSAVCCVCTAFVALLASCHEGPQAPSAEDLRLRFELEPLGEPLYPPDNQPSEARILLGRLLFFDPILSGERDVSCGTCHHPDFAFADGRQFGAGVSGKGIGPSRVLSNSAYSGAPIPELSRNTLTILNAAHGLDVFGAVSYESPLFWDGRVAGLEQQAIIPIASHDEMRGDAFPGTEEEAAAVALDSITLRLNGIPQYAALFREAFGLDAADTVAAVSPSRLAQALAAYERELVTANTPYDRFAAGDDDALTAAQRRGLEIFFSRGKCSLCHRGPTFSHFLFRVSATPQEGIGESTIPGDDTGRAEHTGRPEDRYQFRVSGLRNVELTAPYMHAGVFETLEEVVMFYNHGGQPRNPNVPAELITVAMKDSLGLTAHDVADVVSFLTALTDPGSQIDPLLLTVPTSVPSGLTPVVGLGSSR